jgi:hypothetical protein
MPFANAPSSLEQKIGLGLSVCGTLIIIVMRNKN